MSQTLKTKRKSRLRRAAVIAGSVTALTAGLAGSAFAAAPDPLPYQASAFQDKYQPLFDYDHDGCYPSSAVDKNGHLNGGLNTVGDPGAGCRFIGRANTYVRSACDATWCAYVYTLYFEKDQGPIGGHRHDWEAVVAWQKRGQEAPSYISVSAHGGYSSKAFNTIERSGNRAHIVYHLDGGSTHAFRFAKAGEQPEAVKGVWDRPALVALDKLKQSNRTAFDALWNSNWIEPGLTFGANFPIQDRDGHFQTTLTRARESVNKDLGNPIPSFNPNVAF
ncbi:NPP1 family protein [Streptomyces geranii]|uniref:NPP1 family protein n=1 Tax=Streptomyces geranii TaxID=2058923 RepID=UPI000D03D7D9|nr:NPP1 family protein [Streptomyces geranii]